MAPLWHLVVVCDEVRRAPGAALPVVGGFLACVG
jgi:hypothetical protein